jgi:hypothetical protein
MEITIKRGLDNHQSTTGFLYLEGQLFCVTLEDRFQSKKVKGETRIQAGRYQIKLRKNSTMAERYYAKYGILGMLHLQDVPNYTNVYLHIGNTKEDTRGCILVGSILQQSIQNNSISQKILGSTPVYKNLWSKINDALTNNAQVWVTVLD